MAQGRDGAEGAGGGWRDGRACEGARATPMRDASEVFAGFTISFPIRIHYRVVNFVESSGSLKCAKENVFEHLLVRTLYTTKRNFKRPFRMIFHLAVACY